MMSEHAKSCGLPLDPALRVLESPGGVRALPDVFRTNEKVIGTVSDAGDSYRRMNLVCSCHVPLTPMFVVKRGLNSGKLPTFYFSISERYTFMTQALIISLSAQDFYFSKRPARLRPGRQCSQSECVYSDLSLAIQSLLDSYPKIVGQRQCNKIKVIAFQFWQFWQLMV
jgi:hypothetical protein